jgi:hypothetical protein
MKTVISILLMTIGITAMAEESNISLHCQEETTNTGNNLTLQADNIEFTLLETQKTCTQEFKYRKSGTNKDLFTITSWPATDELGMNAQNDIFIASTHEKTAHYIGSIPVSANFTKENTYQNITQEGGSIYETIYFIESDKITIQEPHKELIFGDTQCIYSRKNSNTCDNYTGTYEEPLCIFNIDGRKILKKTMRCADLFWNK